MSIDIDNLPCESMTFIIFILMLSHIYYFYGPLYWMHRKHSIGPYGNKRNNFPLSKSKLSRILKNSTHSKFTRRVSPSKCIHTHQHTVWKCAFKSGAKNRSLKERFLVINILDGVCCISLSFILQKGKYLNSWESFFLHGST